MTRGAALAAAALACLALAAPAARAADAVRVQAEGVAPLPAAVPGKPPAPPPTAEALRALRQAAALDGVDRAVLQYAAQFARSDVRDDADALRAALGGGHLDGFTLGYGVTGDIGARAVKPKPGETPRPRKPSEPIPMEHAWRIEAVVDGGRVRAALEAAGLALASGTDSGTVVDLVLDAPYDAPMLAALRARLVAMGALGAVPRRYEAAGVTVQVRGLKAEVLREGLVANPPPGYAAELAPVEAGAPPAPAHVRLRSSAPGAAAPRAPRVP